MYKIYQVYKGDKYLHQSKSRGFLKEQVFINRITLSTEFLNYVFKVNVSSAKEDFLFCHYSFYKVLFRG